KTDVSDPDDIHTVVKAAREFGGVNIMVNNAGIHVPESVLDVTAEEFDTTMDINVRGVLLGSQFAAQICSIERNLEPSSTLHPSTPIMLCETRLPTLPQRGPSKCLPMR